MCEEVQAGLERVPEIGSLLVNYFLRRSRQDLDRLTVLARAQVHSLRLLKSWCIEGHKQR